MESVTMHTRSAEVTQACGQKLGQLVRPGDVLLLSGDLGAGKTQLTKGLAVGLGVEDPVTSPTFNILLVHRGRIPLYHFDLYRLEMAGQLEDLDYFDTLEADGVSVVEWGDRFTEAEPRDGVIVAMFIEGDCDRRIQATSLGRRGADLIADWVASCAAISAVRVEDGAWQ